LSAPVKCWYPFQPGRTCFEGKTHVPGLPRTILHHSPVPPGPFSLFNLLCVLVEEFFEDILLYSSLCFFTAVIGSCFSSSFLLSQTPEFLFPLHLVPSLTLPFFFFFLVCLLFLTFLILPKFPPNFFSCPFPWPFPDPPWALLVLFFPENFRVSPLSTVIFSFRFRRLGFPYLLIIHFSSRSFGPSLLGFAARTAVSDFAGAPWVFCVFSLV